MEQFTVIQFDSGEESLLHEALYKTQTYCPGLYSVTVKKVSDLIILNFPKQLKSNPNHCPD